MNPSLTYDKYILKVCGCLKAQLRFRKILIPASKISRCAEFIYITLILEHGMDLQSACKTYAEALIPIIERK